MRDVVELSSRYARLVSFLSRTGNILGAVPADEMTRRDHGAQGGFTLIELLAVIAVLAVLSGVVVLATGAAALRARTRACVTEHGVILTALESDKLNNQHGEYAGVAGSDGLDTVRVDGYLDWEPKSTYWRYIAPPLFGRVTSSDLVRVGTTAVPSADCPA